MYLRYIHKLHDLHTSADNFLEAGFTMKLYADQLTWSTRILPVSAFLNSGRNLRFLNERILIFSLINIIRGKKNGNGRNNFIIRSLLTLTGERYEVLIVK